MASSHLETAQDKLVSLDTKCNPGHPDILPALSDEESSPSTQTNWDATNIFNILIPLFFCWVFIYLFCITWKLPSLADPAKS